MPQDTAASQVPLPDSRDYIELEGVAVEEAMYRLWQALYPVPGAYDQAAGLTNLIVRTRMLCLF